MRKTNRECQYIEVKDEGGPRICGRDDRAGRAAAGPGSQAFKAAAQKHGSEAWHRAAELTPDMKWTGSQTV